MGGILQAKCTCGYKSNSLFVGSGFRNFDKSCLLPALCKKCSSLFVLDYLKKKVGCPKCKGEVIFYYDETLQKKTKSKYSVFEWYINEKVGSIKLPDTQYTCPACGEMKLEFERAGNWD